MNYNFGYKTFQADSSVYVATYLFNAYNYILYSPNIVVLKLTVILKINFALCCSDIRSYVNTYISLQFFKFYQRMCMYCIGGGFDGQKSCVLCSYSINH